MRFPRARFVMAIVVAALAFTAVAAHQAGQDQVQLRAAIKKESVDGDLKGAIAIYQQLRQSADRAVAAQALVRMGQCYERLGAAESAEARKAYEEVVGQYSDQAQAVADAKTRLAALGVGSAGRKPANGPVMTLVHSLTTPFGWPSVDGRYFVRMDPASGGLLVTEGTTGAPRAVPLKSGPPGGAGRAQQASISPDNRLIAFAWWTGSAFELRVVPFDGGADPRTIFSVPDVGPLNEYSWTPDSSQIVAVSWRNGSTVDIDLIPVSGGQPRKLMSAVKDVPSYWSLSPDGRVLAFSQARSATVREHDIFLLRLADNAVTPLIDHPANDWMVGWTRDGSQILFRSDRSGTHDLWAQPVKDGKVTGRAMVLKSDLGRVNWTFLTRDGRLYCNLISQLPDVYVADVDLAADRFLGEPRSLDERRASGHRAADVSRDGRFLSYVLDGRTQDGASLWIRDLRTGTERRVQPSISGLNFPRLSADGSALLMGGRRDDEYAYWRIDVRTGEATAVLPTQRFLNGYSAVSWMPDERSLAFVRHVAEPVLTRFLVVRDIATGAERELARIAMPLYVGHVDPSPDGKWLAFVRLDQGKPAETELCVISTDGGEVRTLHRFGGMINAVAWSPDSRQVLFAGTAKGSKNGSLWKTALATGATSTFDRDLGLPLRQFGQLEVLPDGRRVLFAAGEPKSELWLLEHFLPEKK